MKTKSLLSMLILGVLLLFTAGCEKNEDEPESGDNYFTYNGKNYTLNKGVIEYYGRWDGEGYNFDLTLFSDGITYDIDDGEATGTGHVVYIELYSSGSTSIATGTYHFDLMCSESPFTCSTVMFGITLNMETQTGTILMVGSGNVKVSRDGIRYVLSFDFKTNENKTITGKFRGDLPVHDWSWKKSKRLGAF